jgi:rod shape determining protein RodA
MVDYAATERVSARSRARARDTSFLRNLDWVLLLAVGGLVSYGLWAIDGITRGDVQGDPNYYVLRQAIYALLGVAGMLAMTLLEPSFWRRHAKTMYVVLIALLVIAPVFGAEVRNTRRWIDIGPFRFQPSEFGKLLLVLFLAAFLAERGKRIAERRTTLTATGLALLPIVLVFLQPDFGTAIVYAAVLGAVLFVAGTGWGHIAALVGGAALAGAFVLWIGPSIGVDILKPYQRARITGFTNPSQDPGGSTSRIASCRMCGAVPFT